MDEVQTIFFGGRAISRPIFGATRCTANGALGFRIAFAFYLCGEVLFFLCGCASCALYKLVTSKTNAISGAIKPAFDGSGHSNYLLSLTGYAYLRAHGLSHLRTTRAPSTSRVPPLNHAT
jgi:hypothetical protein